MRASSRSRCRKQERRSGIETEKVLKLTGEQEGSRNAVVALKPYGGPGAFEEGEGSRNAVVALKPGDSAPPPSAGTRSRNAVVALKP